VGKEDRRATVLSKISDPKIEQVLASKISGGGALAMCESLGAFWMGMPVNCGSYNL